MRLPYIPPDPSLPDPTNQAVVDRIKTRRNGTLLELDRALLHAPQIADGWNSFLGAIRTKNSLPDSIRELAIARVAVLNQAWYEWEAHAPLLRNTGAVSEEAVEELKQRECKGKGLDEKHRAVLEVTDAMTVGVVVPQGKFDALKRLFSEREIVEITTTVAAYNCVSRFLVAMDVGEMSEKYGVDMS